MPKSKPTISNKTVAYNGSMVAVAAVFAYSTLVMAYTVVRSSATICSIMPTDETMTILMTNFFSVAYAVVIFSIIMAIPWSVAGAVAAVIIRKSLAYFNPRFDFKKAALISCVTSLVLLIVGYSLLYRLLKDWMTFNYAETFLFWFLFPAAIFFVACIIGGTTWNKILNKDDRMD
jgi:hypothetical protein